LSIIKTALKHIVVAPAATVSSIFDSSKRRRDKLLAPITRREFIDSIPKLKSTLELGPFENPQIVGKGATYFDVLDQEGLRTRAVKEGRDPAGCPVIDFVSDSGDLTIIPGPFDAVFSAHVVEHQHDLIRHLVDVDRLLKPGGRYYLVIPDKRYCFDHFLQTSSIDDVIQVADKGPSMNIQRAIRDSYHNLAHSVAMKHWLGLHGQRVAHRGMDKADCEPAVEKYLAGNYHDVHAFHFTPSSFRSILDGLYLSKRSPLRSVAVYDTRFSALEFYAVLEKP
jgi:SAM-dependent methyltransferase